MWPWRRGRRYREGEEEDREEERGKLMEVLLEREKKFTVRRKKDMLEREKQSSRIEVCRFLMR